MLKRLSLKTLLGLTTWAAMGLYFCHELKSLWYLSAIPWIAIGVILAIDRRCIIGITVGIASFLIMAILLAPCNWQASIRELAECLAELASPRLLGVFGTIGGVIGGTFHAVYRGHQSIWFLLFTVLVFEMLAAEFIHSR